MNIVSNMMYHDFLGIYYHGLLNRFSWISIGLIFCRVAGARRSFGLIMAFFCWLRCCNGLDICTGPGIRNSFGVVHLSIIYLFSIVISEIWELLKINKFSRPGYSYYRMLIMIRCQVIFFPLYCYTFFALLSSVGWARSL